MEHRVAGMRRGLVLASLISLIAAACGTSTPSTAPSASSSQPATSAAPSEVAITPAPIDADLVLDIPANACVCTALPDARIGSDCGCSCRQSVADT